ncbi:MAG: BamA/TamA family outer membrane protein [Saprospiraceae bacterium]|nr:BamA/TamA family outer membrane protein [Saprospiraceae bacterium]
MARCPASNNLLFPLAVLLLSVTTCVPVAAQNTSAADTLATALPKRNNSLIAIPIAYYTPETRLAAGVAGMYTFRFGEPGGAGRPSQVQLGFAYTQEKQLLFYLPFQLFSGDDNWQVSGELGYYRYVYQFFGIGNETRIEDKENYDVNFPRIRLNVLRLVAPRHYLGIRYWWDDYQMVRTAEGGLLAPGNITGSTGGVVSGAGTIWNYEGRDNIFYPTKGYWTEVELFAGNKALGSDFNFNRFSFDAAGYFSKSPRHVVALHAGLVFMSGDPPFQQLAFIGGPRRMRGYFEGRLRDKNLWMLQAEYRTQLSGRFGAVAFAGMGAVAPRAGSLFSQKLNAAFGGGIRFRLSKKEYINLRLDVGINTQGEVFPYLTVREAF